MICKSVNWNLIFSSDIFFMIICKSFFYSIIRILFSENELLKLIFTGSGIDLIAQGRKLFIL